MHLPFTPNSNGLGVQHPTLPKKTKVKEHNSSLANNNQFKAEYHKFDEVNDITSKPHAVTIWKSKPRRVNAKILKIENSYAFHSEYQLSS